MQGKEGQGQGQAFRVIRKGEQPYVVLDVLAALLEAPATVDQLASQLEAAPQTVREGLRALQTVGLAKTSGFGQRAGMRTGNLPFLWAANVQPMPKKA